MNNFKKYFIVLFVLIFFANYEAVLGQCNADLNSLTKTNDTYFDNNQKPFTGVVCEYFDDKTTLKTRIAFINGKKNGLSTSFYSNGIKYFEGSFENDIADGDQKYYYPNGHIFANFNYSHGKLLNISEHYYPDGKPVIEDNLKNGYGAYLNLNNDGSPNELIAVYEGKQLDSWIDGKYSHYDLNRIHHDIRIKTEYNQQGGKEIQFDYSSSQHTLDHTKNNYKSISYYKKLDFDERRNCYYTNDIMVQVKRPDNWLELWRRDKKIYIDLGTTLNYLTSDRSKLPLIGRYCFDPSFEASRETDYYKMADSTAIKINERAFYKYRKAPEPETFEDIYGECMECISSLLIVLPKKITVYTGINTAGSKHDLNPIIVGEVEIKKKFELPINDLYYNYVKFSQIMFNWMRDEKAQDTLPIEKKINKEKIGDLWLHISAFEKD